MHEAAAQRFEPQGTRAAAVLFVVGYVGALGFVTLMLLREFGDPQTGTPWPRAQQALLVAAYLAVGWFVLLYFVVGPRRFRFHDASFEVFTWRGWQRFAWSEVRQAALGTYRANVELALSLGPRRVVSLPIGAFRRGASLLAFIRARVPVPIAATPQQLALLADR